MLQIRKATERGHADHGWLNTYHTFSFGSYHDPRHHQFRSLRVMNEDWVAPGRGFGTHPHRDMEIVTYVLEGALEHKDSMGHGEVLRPGEFQRMSAGTGIEHSEYNPSSSQATHLYQIWLFPEEKNLTPSYEQKQFPAEGRHNRLQRVASRDAAEGSLQIHQDASIFLSELDPDRSVTWQPADSRYTWLQVLKGSVELNGVSLSAGDGAAADDAQPLEMRATTDAQIMLFDLA